MNAPRLPCVEAVRSRQLETMWYSKEKLRSPEKIEKRPTTSDDPLRAWASRQPLPPIMPEPDLKRLESVFQEAADLPAGERSPFLDQACADDPALRTRA